MLKGRKPNKVENGSDDDEVAKGLLVMCAIITQCDV